MRSVRTLYTALMVLPTKATDGELARMVTWRTGLSAAGCPSFRVDRPRLNLAGWRDVNFE
jgi:hypothetical protein